MSGPIFITRLVEFSAAHRLFRDDWTPEQNLEAFGACSNPFGHGHNYELEVTVKGLADPATGMVVHFQKLKSLLQELVVSPLDHRHLNHDVPFLAGKLPTSEVLLLELWNRLAPAIRTSSTERVELFKLKLKSTGRNWAEYYGDFDGRAH